MVMEFVPREQSEVAGELKSKFTRFNSFRQNFEQSAIEDYKSYVGHKSEREAARESEEKGSAGRSNLHIPRTYEVLDTIRARLVSSFFSARPYMEFKPMPEGGSAHQMYVSEQKSEVAGALVDMQLEKNHILDLFYRYVTSMLIFPAAIMGVGWRYEVAPVRRRAKFPDIVQTALGPQFLGWQEQVVENMEEIWDDNEITLVDFFNFWPDPRGEDIDSCRGVFQREWLTREELEQKLIFLYDLQEGVLYPVDLDEVQGEGSNLEEGVWERLSKVGIHAGSPDAYMTHAEGPDRRKGLFEVLHYWEDNRHAILLNRNVVVYDGPSPYWRHRKKPFVVASYEPLPGEFYGRSATRLIGDLQHELNTQRNQRIDNVSMVLNRMWKIRRNSVLNKADLVSRPGGVLEVDDMNSVEPMVTPDVTSSSYQEEMITKQDMENTLGAPPVVRGAEGTRKETATGQSIKATGAGIRFEVKIRLFEGSGLERLAMLMDMNNQQFINENRLVKMGPEESIMWREVSPDQLVGEYEYRPAGTSLDPAANREIRRAQLSEMMQFMLATQNPFLDMYEITKAYVESFDLRNPQKFMIPREIVEQQMAQQQQMMQAMMAQEALESPEGGGRGQPAPGPMMAPGPAMAGPGPDIPPPPGGFA